MPIPLRLWDRGKLLPATLAAHILERTQKLAQFFGRVKECRVVIDGPGQHELRDRIRVRIHLTVPGSEIAVTRQGGADLPAAICAAFDAADRRLEDYVRLARECVKGAKRRRARD
jgi:ribosome-associated translation inhibitor RaiA